MVQATITQAIKEYEEVIEKLKRLRENIFFVGRTVYLKDVIGDGISMRKVKVVNNVTGIPTHVRVSDGEYQYTVSINKLELEL